MWESWQKLVLVCLVIIANLIVWLDAFDAATELRAGLGSGLIMVLAWLAVTRGKGKGKAAASLLMACLAPALIHCGGLPVVESVDGVLEVQGDPAPEAVSAGFTLDTDQGAIELGFDVDGLIGASEDRSFGACIVMTVAQARFEACLRCAYGEECELVESEPVEGAPDG